MAPVSSAAIAAVRAFSRDLALAGGLLSPDYLESGFSLGEARCLYELGQTDGLAVSALAEGLGLDLGYVSRVVSRLAADGLVQKRTGDDRRVRLVALTRRGQARVAELGARADRRLGAWLAGKPPGSVARLVDGVGAFVGEPGDIVVREGRPGDAGRIIARHAEIYGGEFGYPDCFEGYVVAAFADLLQGFAPPRDRLLVAERGGVFLGSVALKGRARGTTQLRFLLVERAARGTGLGKRLVGAVVDHARAIGEGRIILETASDLAAARGLYAAHGFEKIAEAPAEFLPRGVMSETWTLELRSRAHTQVGSGRNGKRRGDSR